MLGVLSFLSRPANSTSSIYYTWRAAVQWSTLKGPDAVYLGSLDTAGVSVLITSDRELLPLAVSRRGGGPLLSGWLFCNGPDWQEEDVCPGSAPRWGRLYAHHRGACCT